MGADVRLWQIRPGDQLVEVSTGRLDLESRLQEWLARDISVLDPGLLVIGREVGTDFGGFIDLLCMDAAGDLVVVELKRDKTPREITAQALDYASWVAGLSNDRVTAIADDYLDAGLEAAFTAKFDAELPETLNGDHRILVVGSQIDPGSERIIRYLSEMYGVNINAGTFQYFRLPDGAELLARVFLIEPSEVELSARTRGASRRRPNLSYDELVSLAAEAGVVELYAHAVSAFEPLLQKHTTRSSIVFTSDLNGSRRTIIAFLPGESSSDEGLHFHVYKYRYAALAELEVEAVESLMPENRRDWTYTATSDLESSGYEGFIARPDEIDRLVSPLRPHTG